MKRMIFIVFITLCVGFVASYTIWQSLPGEYAYTLKTNIVEPIVTEGFFASQLPIALCMKRYSLRLEEIDRLIERDQLREKIFTQSLHALDREADCLENQLLTLSHQDQEHAVIQSGNLDILLADIHLHRSSVLREQRVVSNINALAQTSMALSRNPKVVLGNPGPKGASRDMAERALDRARDVVGVLPVRSDDLLQRETIVDLFRSAEDAFLRKQYPIAFSFAERARVDGEKYRLTD